MILKLNVKLRRSVTKHKKERHHVKQREAAEEEGRTRGLN